MDEGGTTAADQRAPADQEMAGPIQRGLPRRALVRGGLVAGLTLATARVEAQVIHTGTDGLVAEAVQVPAADGTTLPAYVARPAGDGPFPTILVIEEIFGVHEYIRDICRRLAHRGFLAVAPELYARLGDLSKMSDVQQIFRDVILRAPDSTLLADLDHTAAWTAQNHGDPGRLGVVGFCRGGRDAWLYAAHNPDLRAAVAFYGPVTGPVSAIQPRTPTDIAADLKCPLLGLYGGKDPSIAVADVQMAAARAHKAGRTVEVVVYPEAGHGFHADYRPTYHAADAQAAWGRMLDWFTRHGL